MLTDDDDPSLHRTWLVNQWLFNLVVQDSGPSNQWWARSSAQSGQSRWHSGVDLFEPQDVRVTPKKMGHFSPS